MSAKFNKVLSFGDSLLQITDEIVGVFYTNTEYWERKSKIKFITLKFI